MTNVYGCFMLLLTQVFKVLYIKAIINRMIHKGAHGMRIYITTFSQNASSFWNQSISGIFGMN